MAGKLLLINPRRRRKASAKKRRSAKRVHRRRNPMPASLKSFFAGKRKRSTGKRVHRTRRRLARVHRRRRNPVSVRGFVSQVGPMTVDATLGAAGAIGLEYVWGFINPKLPASLQSMPGKLGIGDAVKVLATVAIGTTLNRATKGFAMRGAKGALTIQAYNILKAMLPASITQNLAYAQPAPVINGQAWIGPNAVYRGAPLGPLQNTMGALMKPGSRTPLLNGAGVGALMRPGGSPLLSRVRAGMPLR